MRDFRHLCTFSIAGAELPVRKAESLLSTRLQLEVVEKALKEDSHEGPSLGALKEPDLSHVNYLDKVRGTIQSIWQPVVEDPDHIPPPQLLNRLNAAWISSEKKIGEDVQVSAAKIFDNRAHLKAKIAEEEATRIAANKGIPSAIGWLEGVQSDCEEARKVLGQELQGYENRRKRQKGALEELKEEWVSTLSDDLNMEPRRVARKFLFLAALVLLVGMGLWLASIPLNSILGALAAVIVTLLGLRVSWPIFSLIRLAKRKKLTAIKLASSFKALALFGLDLMTKRLELEYYGETLRTHIVKIQEEFRKRASQLESKRGDFLTHMRDIQGSLLEAPPTVRPLLRPEDLEDWYKKGRSQAPITGWTRTIVSLENDPVWNEIGQEARQIFSFLKGLKAEDEIYRLYPDKEGRMAFLQTLKDAAIGRSEGEASLSLDFAETQGKAPEVYLVVEIADPEHSKLAREIKDAWGNGMVGISTVGTSDPYVINLFGIVYGFNMGALREWEKVEDSFERVHKTEGKAIYPVLFPEDAEVAR